MHRPLQLPATLALAAAATLLHAPVFGQAPVLSELMPRNVSTLADGDGDFPDWLEIHNPATSRLDLTNWYLTDNPQDLDRWRFPATTSIPAGGYLVVFCSAKYRPPAGELHTNFTLDGDGDYLALVQPDRSTIISSYSPGFPELLSDHSYGPNRNGINAIFTGPTPGAANGFGAPSYAAEPDLNVPPGIYDTPIDVTIVCDTLSATLRFTTDGTQPTLRNGSTYTSPLRLTSSTCLRVTAFANGRARSKIRTRTYLFADDVLRQPARPPGFPSSWGGAPAADYEMDTEVVDAPAYRDRIIQGLRALPVVSIVSNPATLFERNGIYSNTGLYGPDSERPTTAEMFWPDGRREFDVDCGIRLQGNASRSPANSPKHSFSLRFRDRYGKGKLKHPVFPGSRVSTFDSLQLRANFSNGWLNTTAAERTRGTLIRDSWMRDTLLELGHADAGHGRYTHLFLNGLYWGVYTLHERPNQDHATQWQGPNSYDSRTGGQFTHGSNAKWSYLTNTVRARDWPLIQTLMDVDNFIDYVIAHRFAGNTDMTRWANWRAVGGGSNLVPWRFFTWDAERIFQIEDDDWAEDPTLLLEFLDDIPEFRVRFGDRVQRAFFHGGPLSLSKNVARWNRHVSRLDLAVIMESARWGDYRRDVHRYETGPFELLTRDGVWLDEIDRVTNRVMPLRHDLVLGRFSREGLFPSVVAPTFNQHGGQISAGFDVQISAPNGSIFYTVDGSDPRLAGGGLGASAQRYASEFSLRRNTVVNARVRAGGNWSALTRALFTVDPVRINELLAKNETVLADEAGQFDDWVELFNPSPAAIDVGGMFLSDDIVAPRKWSIPINTFIPANGTLLIWCDDDQTQGPYHAPFKLATAGEEVALFDRDANLLDHVVFGPQVADVSTGRFYNGRPQLVTFLEPSPAESNQSRDIRQYSSLDSRTQPIVLTSSQRPTPLGATFELETNGGPSFPERLLLISGAVADTAFPQTISRFLLGSPALTFRSLTANANGRARGSFQLPTDPILAGRTLFFQAWSIDLISGAFVGSNGLALRIQR